MTPPQAAALLLSLPLVNCFGAPSDTNPSYCTSGDAPGCDLVLNQLRFQCSSGFADFARVSSSPPQFPKGGPWRIPAQPTAAQARSAAPGIRYAQAAASTAPASPIRCATPIQARACTTPLRRSVAETELLTRRTVARAQATTGWLSHAVKWSVIRPQRNARWSRDGCRPSGVPHAALPRHSDAPPPITVTRADLPP
eukprot:CAMPEP_0181196976 /NCGR_PEP_ID=MMETSP1096-20121128/15774_1 /TAXON_ID=156174 ORGANISM="Chrysochromulina ericina, Strain CCMP281" /NCGR_SAMPLE_ID=MMETSP1096 /ASSEMBLY_ACC=CAM_ASM_000453 /LENGTH=196 /DNA_ID=CAMNT_0023286815 /DNA_START=24 /DNA_END=612 /DNA_ORIENTATION=-